MAETLTTTTISPMEVIVEYNNDVDAEALMVELATDLVFQGVKLELEHHLEIHHSPHQCLIKGSFIPHIHVRSTRTLADNCRVIFI